MTDALLLRNYANAARVLRYVPTTGEHEEVGPTPEHLLARGYFEEVNGQLLGAYASADGAMFFLGRERFRTRDPAFALEWLRGEREHTFRLLWDGVVRFEARYAPKTEWGWDVWSADEESADYLLWLCNSVRGGEPFHAFYTLAST